MADEADENIVGDQPEEEAEQAQRQGDQPPTGGVKNTKEAVKFQRKCTAAAAMLVSKLQDPTESVGASGFYRVFLIKLRSYSSDIVKSMRLARLDKVLAAVQDINGVCLLNNTTYRDPDYFAALEAQEQKKKDQAGAATAEGEEDKDTEMDPMSRLELSWEAREQDGDVVIPKDRRKEIEELFEMHENVAKIQLRYASACKTLVNRLPTATFTKLLTHLTPPVLGLRMEADYYTKPDQPQEKKKVSKRKVPIVTPPLWERPAVTVLELMLPNPKSQVLSPYGDHRAFLATRCLAACATFYLAQALDHTKRAVSKERAYEAFSITETRGRLAINGTLYVNQHKDADEPGETDDEGPRKAPSAAAGKAPDEDDDDDDEEEDNDEDKNRPHKRRKKDREGDGKGGAGGTGGADTGRDRRGRSRDKDRDKDEDRDGEGKKSKKKKKHKKGSGATEHEGTADDDEAEDQGRYSPKSPSHSPPDTHPEEFALPASDFALPTTPAASKVARTAGKSQTPTTTPSTTRAAATVTAAPAVATTTDATASTSRDQARFLTLKKQFKKTHKESDESWEAGSTDLSEAREEEANDFTSAESTPIQTPIAKPKPAAKPKQFTAKDPAKKDRRTKTSVAAALATSAATATTTQVDVHAAPVPKEKPILQAREYSTEELTAEELQLFKFEVQRFTLQGIEGFEAQQLAKLSVEETMRKRAEKRKTDTTVKDLLDSGHEESMDQADVAAKKILDARKASQPQEEDVKPVVTSTTANETPPEVITIDSDLSSPDAKPVKPRRKAFIEEDMDSR